MVLTFVKADKVADFELVLGSWKRRRWRRAGNRRPQQQAAGWKIFQATETTSTRHALIRLHHDPPVEDADQSVTPFWRRASASESQAVLRMY